jgi:hypothetical protein
MMFQIYNLRHLKWLTYRAQKAWTLILMTTPMFCQYRLLLKGLITSAAVICPAAAVAIHVLPVCLLCIEMLQTESTLVLLLLPLLQCSNEGFKGDTIKLLFLLILVSLHRKYCNLWINLILSDSVNTRTLYAWIPIKLIKNGKTSRKKTI